MRTLKVVVVLLGLSLLARGTLHPVHAQGSASGTIAVTVATESATPIVDAFITFRAEGETVERGSCVTDTQGTCTLQVRNAPTDKSGLIRGYVYVGEGDRPVLWPGGDLTITITTTDSGLLRPPADFIDSDKGTPTPTATGIAVPSTATALTRTPTATRTPRATVTPTPSATASPALVTEEEGNLAPVDALKTLGGCLYLLFCLTCLYFLVSRSLRLRSRKGEKTS